MKTFKNFRLLLLTFLFLKIDVVTCQRSTQIYLGSNYYHFSNSLKNISGIESKYTFFESNFNSIGEHYEVTEDINTTFKSQVSFEAGVMSRFSINSKLKLAYGTYLDLFRIKYKQDISNIIYRKLLSNDTSKFRIVNPSSDSMVYSINFNTDGYNRIRQYVVQLPIELSYSLTPKLEIFGQVAIGFTFSQKELITYVSLKETKIINGRKTNFLELADKYEKITDFINPLISFSLGARKKLFNYFYLDGRVSYTMNDLIRNHSNTHGTINGINYNIQKEIPSKPIGVHLGFSYIF
ncbi:MAG: hypothetical protein ABIO44_11615 [Saprospiraceae bacterium]